MKKSSEIRAGSGELEENQEENPGGAITTERFLDSVAAVPQEPDEERRAATSLGLTRVVD